MILFVPVKLKEIFEKGKEYPWEKPKRCPVCKSCRVWGHGFVTACFDGFSEPLFIKLYRCDDCHSVIRIRPAGYFSRFQASIEIIKRSISSKIEEGKWLSGISRTRQNHWFRAFCRKMKAYFGLVPLKPDAFNRLLKEGTIPVSRAI